MSGTIKIPPKKTKTIGGYKIKNLGPGTVFISGGIRLVAIAKPCPATVIWKKETWSHS